MKLLNFDKTNKEDAKHAFWSCFSIRYLYEDLEKELKIEELIRAPITAKNVIIGDEGKTSDTPKCNLENFKDKRA